MDARLGRLWLDVVQLASTISLNDEEDAMTWQLVLTGFTLPKLYTRLPILEVFYLFCMPSNCALKIRPRVHFFFPVAPVQKQSVN